MSDDFGSFPASSNHITSALPCAIRSRRPGLQRPIAFRYDCNTIVANDIHNFSLVGDSDLHIRSRYRCRLALEKPAHGRDLWVIGFAECAWHACAQNQDDPHSEIEMQVWSDFGVPRPTGPCAPGLAAFSGRRFLRMSALRQHRRLEANEGADGWRFVELAADRSFTSLISTRKSNRDSCRFSLLIRPQPQCLEIFFEVLRTDSFYVSAGTSFSNLATVAYDQRRTTSCNVCGSSLALLSGGR